MTPPTVLVVEHAADCPPALLGEWLAAEGCALDVRRPYAGDDLPDPAAYDALLVLGGPMGAEDDEQAPWLPVVRDRVREAVRDATPTLGVCLGHQLIAVALGGTVARNPAGQQLGLLERRLDRRRRRTTSCWARWPHHAAACSGTTTSSPRCRRAPRCWPRRRPARCRRCGSRPRCGACSCTPRSTAACCGPGRPPTAARTRPCGIDQDALLRSVDEARAELDAAWRPLAASFAALAAAAPAAGSRAER